MPKHMIEEYRGALLVEWLESLDYYQIRSVETILPAMFSDKRRVRGIIIAPNICIARDRKMYFINPVTNVAQRMTYDDVRRLGYTVSQLAACFNAARSSVLSKRTTRPYRKDGVTDNIPVAPK